MIHKMSLFWRTAWFFTPQVHLPYRDPIFKDHLLIKCCNFNIPCYIWDWFSRKTKPLLFLLYKNWSALYGFPLLGKIVSTHFSSVWYHQLPAYMWHIFSAMNKWQRVLSLKRVVFLWSFCRSLQSLMRYRVEHSRGNSISPRTQLILYLFLYFLTSISYQYNNNFMKRAVQTCSLWLFYIM